MPLQEYEREKQDKRTNTCKTLGVNLRAEGELCNTLCMCRLTLAWVTSETSTKQLERRLILTRSSGPHLQPLVSPLRCPVSTAPVRGTTSAPFSNQLSSRVPLPLPATPRFQVQKPFVWFRAKTDKGIVCLVGHLYSVTDNYSNAQKWRSIVIISMGDLWKY